MALNYVTLTGTINGAGGAVATFTATNWLTDAGDQQVFAPAPVQAHLGPTGTFSVSLLATDNSGPLPSGWLWTVEITEIAGIPAYSFSFFLPFANGATQDFSALVPVSTPPAVVTYMPMPAGNPLAGQVPAVQTDGNPYTAWRSVFMNPMSAPGDIIVGGASGAAARLAGDTTNVRKFLRGLSVGGVAQAPAWDTLVAADVPTLNQNTTGTAGNVTGVVAVGHGGTGQTDQQSALNALTGTQSAGKYVRSDGTNATLAPIQASDVPTLNQNTTGTSGNVTGTVAIGNGGTGQTGQQAAITALTGTQSAGKYLRSDGTNAALANIQASDVPTLNQNTTGTSANVTGTVAIGNGGTGQTTQQAAINALTGAQSAGKYVRSDGTNAALAVIQAADVPTLNQNTTGTAANVTATLDQIPAPGAAVSLNTKKITSLANGTAASDAAAFGQIPTALPPNGSASGDLSGSYPGPTVSKLNNVALPATPKTFKPANPTSTTSTTVVMMGLGAAGSGQACLFTPAGTGHVRIIITGAAFVATSGSTNVILGGRYGTGTAPANAAAPSGTAFGVGGAGTDILLRPTQAATSGASFCMQEILTLTPSTQYWFDLAVAAPSAGNAGSVANLVVTIEELPT